MFSFVLSIFTLASALTAQATIREKVSIDPKPPVQQSGTLEVGNTIALFRRLASTCGQRTNMLGQSFSTRRAREPSPEDEDPCCLDPIGINN
jgi:hypothetical protein